MKKKKEEKIAWSKVCLACGVTIQSELDNVYPMMCPLCGGKELRRVS